MIRTENLTKYYKDFPALLDLNIDIPEGKVFGFIGPNGAGKTTTIRILCGLMRASRGEAYIGGLPVSKNISKVRSLIGYLPDDFGVYEGMRVWEYLDFFGAAYKIPRKQRKLRLDWSLEIVEASHMRDYFVDSLSKGMRQKVGLAKTLLHQPKVLILDEPANGLDPRARIELRETLRLLAEQHKITIMVSSHILLELATMSDMVGIIDQGKLLATGGVDEVMNKVRTQRQLLVRCSNDPAKGKPALEQLVADELIAGYEIIEELIRIDCNGPEQDNVAINRALVEAGLGVLSLREHVPDLEELFMKLTEHTDVGEAAS